MLVVCINTVSPFTAYQRCLVIHHIQVYLRSMWVEGGGDITIKTLVIASCESCPSRRRRYCIIPGTVLRKFATSQSTSENRELRRTYRIPGTYHHRTVRYSCGTEDVHTSKYNGPSYVHLRMSACPERATNFLLITRTLRYFLSWLP